MDTRLFGLGGIMLLAAGGCSLVLGFDKDYHAQGSGGAGGADHASSSTSTGTSTGGTSSTTTTGTGTGGAGGASTTTGTGAGGAGCQPGEGTVLALTKLDFGDGNNGQWKKVGFDIDGLTSTGASVDLCQPNSGGAPGAAYPDGDSGIDNSFGKNFLPQLLAIYPDWVMDVNGGLQSGDFNLLMKMYCLPPAGDVPTLTTKLFGGTALGKAPKYDGTDPWPVAPEHLSNPLDPESSTIVFGQSSVMGTTFDSAKKVSFILTIPMSASGMSVSMNLTLHAAHVTMDLAADRKSATSGRMGGVLDTEEFVAEIKKVGQLLGLCGSPVFDGFLTQIRQASDIRADGSQDPAKTCDGISIGLGFEMKEVQLGGVGPMAPVEATCP